TRVDRPTACAYHGTAMTERALSHAGLRRLRAHGAVESVLRSADVEPMLASLAEPFSRAGWLFEVKYDGFRMLASKEDGRPRLRRGTDVTARFPEVAAAVEALPGADLVLDGEVVVLDEQGRPDFQRMQKRFVLRRAVDVAAAARALPASLFAFDLLAADDLD